MTRERRRLLIAGAAAMAVLAPLGWMWQQSLLPDSYSVMEMGYTDLGGGPALAPMAHEGRHGSGHEGAVSVPDLVVDPDRSADVRVELDAREETLTLASGRVVDGFTLNGTSPGPTIEARQGDLVEVVVRNESVHDGMTLHWHGLDVPNAEDGVAGVTQNAIEVGETHTYRFVAEDAGTYWYHSHQVSHAQVRGGLLGALVIRPADRRAQADVDRVVVTHTYRGTRTLDGLEGDVPVRAQPGDVIRLRLVNTDDGPVEVWTDQPFRLLAVDGRDLQGPTEVEDRSVVLTAGGRGDLELVVPDSGAARVQVGGGTAVVVGPAGATAAKVAQPAEDLDLLTYGTPADLGFDPTRPDRTFAYDIDRRPGFLDGRPGLWWTINGHLFPDVPMYVVREGDVVVMEITNESGEVHPMHLHGHHAVVLSRDGVAATGSPWWVDSLNVRNGETYEIAFLADNPGIWMDHCHNLPHAAEGLVAHLMYEGVTTPYRVGDGGNEPE